jgi:hypothetical protein
VCSSPTSGDRSSILYGIDAMLWTLLLELPPLPGPAAKRRVERPWPKIAGDQGC